MSAPPDIRSQLRSLSIPKDQRPASAQGPAPAKRLASSAPAKARRSMRPFVIVGVLLVVGVALVAGALKLKDSVGGGEPPPATRLLAIHARSDGESPPVFTAAGKIVSDHKVLVNTKVSGQIIGLAFEQGDRVQKGQVMARIEDILYKARRDQCAAQVEKTKASLQFNTVNFERISRLYKTGNAPEMEFIDAKRAFEEAQAQLGVDKAALDYAQKALTDCELTAPISGVILERNVEIGDFVAAEGGRGAQANAQLASIADMSMLRVEVDVSELDIARVKKDMPCTIKPDAYKDRRYKGHVMWLDPGANYSKATVQVKVRIDNPDDSLRVEGSAQVAFLAEEPRDLKNQAATIWIPASASLRDADGKTARVFVAVDGKLKQQAVKIGRESGSQLEIVGGLSEGQSILVDGLDKAADGQVIKP
jgi:RND family efflux transporter MFP subunit